MNEYYNRTDVSIAWVVSVALYPQFKMAYFDSAWSGSLCSFIGPAKTKLRRLWERDYKSDSMAGCIEKSPELAKKPSYLESVLN